MDVNDKLGDSLGLRGWDSGEGEAGKEIGDKWWEETVREQGGVPNP